MDLDAVRHAQGLLDAGRPEQALPILRAELAGDPTDPRLHLLAAIAQARLGALAEAEHHARAVLPSPELHASACQLLAEILGHDPARHAEALDAAAGAVRSQPQSWHNRATLAAALIRVRRTRDAIIEARAAVDLTTDDHDRARALAVLAAAHAANRDKTEARVVAVQALRLDPGGLDLLDLLMRIQLATGQRAEAMATALAVLRQAPTDREPPMLARIALYLVEHLLIIGLLLVAVAVPMLTFSALSQVPGALADGGSPAADLAIRLGCAAGLAGALGVIALRLRPLANRSVRAAVLRFARRQALSWFTGIVVVGMLVSYAIGIVAGGALFAALTIPFGLMLLAWLVHGTAGRFVRTKV